MEGNLRNLVCTREEQTGTQLSEEARREQNNSSCPLFLSLSISPTTPSLPSISPVPLAPVPKKRSSARQSYATRCRSESGVETEAERHSQRKRLKWL